MSRHIGLQLLKINLAGVDPGMSLWLRHNPQEKFNIQTMSQLATWAQLFDG